MRFASASPHCLPALPRRVGFALTAVLLALSLAPGVGAGSSNAIHAQIQNGCDIPSCDRLVLVRATGGGAKGDLPIAPGDFFELQQQSSIFQELAAYQLSKSKISDRDGEEPVATANVSVNFFHVVRVFPVLGRTFIAKEEDGGLAVVMLSYDLWQRRFHSDPAIMGRSVSVGGRQSTVVGIMPRQFHFPSPVDVWMPLAFTPEMKAAHNPDAFPGFPSVLVGRLAEGISFNRAQAEVIAFATRLQSEFPDTHLDWSLTLVPGFENQ